uniref:Putative serine protease n=1 Tax=Ixodes ricinus TaxID=34613 RepID=A0A6B0VA52_IXORI
MKADRVILMILFVEYLFSTPYSLSTENCGLPDKQPDHSDCVIKERILNGMDAIPGAWPWQVEVRNSDRHICGGALIGPQHVLTSAHCLTEWELLSLKIRLGSYSSSIKENASEATIETICIHPAYNKSGDEYDIAIITLKNSVNCSQNIKTVCLPNSSDEPDCDNPMYMAGWGYKEPLEYNDRFLSWNAEGISLKNYENVQKEFDLENESQKEDKDTSPSENEYEYDYSEFATPTSEVHNEVPEMLQQAQVQLISNDVCAKLMNESSISTNIVCANHNFGSFCLGDSGGPLVYKNKDARWNLMGLVSATEMPCNVTNVPMLFIRIKPFMQNFIMPCIQNSTCECKQL